MTPAQKCVAEARKYIGVKWRHRGRKPWAIDCIGLVVMAVAAGGVTMRDRTNYGREPWLNGLEQEMREHFGEPVDDWQPGDVVMLRWYGRQEPAHLGILTDYAHGGLAIIHSHSMTTVIEHRLDDYWQKLIVAVYRPRWPE